MTFFILGLGTALVLLCVAIGSYIIGFRIGWDRGYEKSHSILAGPLK